jgi:SAM-dependent methyltransferase
MNELDKKSYIERYNSRFETHGHDIKTLGWGGNKKKQFLRFQTVVELKNFINSNQIKSILDIGCGFGDMGGEFLKLNFPEIKYVGVDINSLLIQEGKVRYPELDLRTLDILEDSFEEKFDIVCESGIFNYKLKNEIQLNYILKMIKKMYSLANYGVSCDFLSTFVDFQHEGAYHMNEYSALEIGKQFSKRIVIRNDYLDYEYCMYIIKDDTDD